jgi:hypothetical protein
MNQGREATDFGKFRVFAQHDACRGRPVALASISGNLLLRVFEP